MFTEKNSQFYPPGVGKRGPWAKSLLLPVCVNDWNAATLILPVSRWLFGAIMAESRSCDGAQRSSKPKIFAISFFKMCWLLLYAKGLMTFVIVELYFWKSGSIFSFYFHNRHVLCLQCIKKEYLNISGYKWEQSTHMIFLRAVWGYAKRGSFAYAVALSIRNSHS